MSWSLNHRVDHFLSHGQTSRKWRLHSKIVNLIWQISAEVEQFASSKMTLCSLWFTWSIPAPVAKYVLAKVEVEYFQLFCGEYRRTSFRFLDLISHLEKHTWRLLVTTDLLSQVLGLLWHPRSDIWRLWVWRLNWELLIYSGFHLISRSHFILCGLNYYVLTFKLIIFYNALIVYIHVFILYLYF